MIKARSSFLPFSSMICAEKTTDLFWHVNIKHLPTSLQTQLKWVKIMSTSVTGTHRWIPGFQKRVRLNSLSRPETLKIQAWTAYFPHQICDPKKVVKEFSLNGQPSPSTSINLQKGQFSGPTQPTWSSSRRRFRADKACGFCSSSRNSTIFGRSAQGFRAVSGDCWL